MNTELRFWVRPTNGVPHEIDLTEFAEGGSIERVVAKARASWAGDFAGRPGLAAELRRLFTSLQPDEKSTAGWKNDFRTLFRFLDSVDPDLIIDESTLLTDLHGVALYDWVSVRSRAYGRIKTHLDRLRALAGANPLVWPARPRDVLGQMEDIELASIKRLYTAMKREGMDIKAMFREGSALASRGSDPRGEVSSRGSAAWHEGETRDYHGRHFCPRCGSSVFSRTADEIEVNLGVLDDPDALVPTYELWTVRRTAWLPPFPIQRRYDRDRLSADRSEA